MVDMVTEAAAEAAAGTTSPTADEREVITVGPSINDVIICQLYYHSFWTSYMDGPTSNYMP